MAKATIVHLPTNEWKILKTNAKGTEETKDTIPDVQPMGDMESILVFMGLVKEETNARRASLSLLAHVWMFGNSVKVGDNIQLRKFVGKGDLKTGNLSNGLKEEFRAAEDLYFKQFLSEEHPAHAAYVGQLPKVNERGEVLAEEDRHSYFVTRTRKSPSYANAKNLFLNYLAFVGHEPFTVEESTGELIGLEPSEVMRERIGEAKQSVPAPDNSWEKRMQDLIREVTAPIDPKKPLPINGARIPGLLQDLRILSDELRRRLKHYEKTESELAAIRAKYHPEDGQKSDVPSEAASMMERAQAATTIGGKPLSEVQAENAGEKVEGFNP